MLLGKNLNLIVAISDNHIIGTKEGKIPWQGLVPSDVSRFVELTSKSGANSVVMGRVTWDTIPEKFRPLLNRDNIVLSRNLAFRLNHDRVFVAHSLKEALDLARTQTIWVCGGAEIYNQALPYADEIHITKIHGKFIGDVKFPPCGIGWVAVYKKFFRKPPDKIFSTYLIFRRNQ